jgi:hypothetical protein
MDHQHQMGTGKRLAMLLKKAGQSLYWFLEEETNQTITTWQVEEESS